MNKTLIKNMITYWMASKDFKIKFEIMIDNCDLKFKINIFIQNKLKHTKSIKIQN